MSMSNPTAMQTGRRHGVAFTILCVAPVAALLAFRITREDEGLELWLARLLFWTMPLVLAFVAIGGIARWRESRQPLSVRLRWMAPGAAYAIVIAVILVAMVPPQMRVQFDETSLVGSSQNMHRHEACLSTAILFRAKTPSTSAHLCLHSSSIFCIAPSDSKSPTRFGSTDYCS